jgi:hypothetical protein
VAGGVVATQKDAGNLSEKKGKGKDNVQCRNFQELMGIPKTPTSECWWQ